MSLLFEPFPKANAANDEDHEKECGGDRVQIAVEQNACNGHLAWDGIALRDHEAEHPVKKFVVDVAGELEIGPGLLVKVVNFGQCSVIKRSTSAYMISICQTG